MSILPSAILALRSGATKVSAPAAPSVRTAPAAAGAGAPVPEPPARKEKKMSKRETALAEARAAATSRIRELVDDKPTRAKVHRYMTNRVSELTLDALS